MESPRPFAVLSDLLMAVMDSPAVWAAAAGDEETGWAWRDGVTRRIISAGAYLPYEQLVTDEAASLALPAAASATLFRRWAVMEPWPDAVSLARLPLPYGFVTNCSASLASLAAESAARAGFRPAFVLSAEEAGWYKPHPAIYAEACRRLGRVPREILYVAGASYDADGARSAGLGVALVLRRPLAVGAGAAVRKVSSLEAALAGIA